MRRAFGAATPMPWRRILIGVAALLLLLVALGVFFLATFDANSQKARLATMVKEKTGRVLSIPADVRLKLFPVIRFELDRAILDEKNSSIPFATIEAVKLSLRLWPLLRRQVILDQVEIGNFSVALQRFANGATNFDDLIAHDVSPSSFRFDLAGLTGTDADGRGEVDRVDVLGRRDDVDFLRAQRRGKSQTQQHREGEQLTHAVDSGSARND